MKIENFDVRNKCNLILKNQKPKTLIKTYIGDYDLLKHSKN